MGDLGSLMTVLAKSFLISEIIAHMANYPSVRGDFLLSLSQHL